MVSTNKGAEGLDVMHDENILIADDPASFTRQVVRLFGDPGLRSRLADNGRRLVEQKYSWSQIGQDFCVLVEEAAQV